MRIDLKPVSINKAYRGGRRFKTRDYLDFEKEMLWMLKSMKCKKVSGDYQIHFKFYMKNALSCDLSNFIKTTEDIIVKAGLVDDDRYCWHMVIDKYKTDDNYLEFEIKKLGRAR